MQENNKDIYKTSRFLYILEAAFEYFVSILVGGSFLAKLTTSIGISDGVTGILESFVSLGCGFQLFAIFLANKRPVKRWVSILHTVNQLAFALIYVVPFFNISKQTKVVLFVLFLLTGHIINNVVNSPKINCFMSLVSDDRRGRFTANKEIVSLLSGMVVSFAMGNIIDRFAEQNNLNGAFIVCGITIFILMILHSLTLIFSVEKPAQKEETIPTGQLIKSLVTDKTLIKVILVSVFWNVANYAATPFYGTYSIKELGFSMTTVSVLSIVGALSRSLASRPLGKFADKNGFVKMLNICFVLEIVRFALRIFTVPSNGIYLVFISDIVHAVAMGGINSSAINLIYDYVDKSKRTGAVALKNTIAGFAGFFITLLMKPLVDTVQRNGNTFFGIPMYAQQLVSAIALLATVCVLIYVNVALRNAKKNTKS